MAVDAYTYEVELKDGAAEYLRYLKEKGIRMAVATSSSPELYEPALKRNGIYEYFKAFVTVSEVKRISTRKRLKSCLFRRKRVWYMKIS